MTYMEGRIGVHIGLPKTGTTSLQKLCFSRHPELSYFGQTNVWTNNDTKTILRALLLDQSVYNSSENITSIIAQAKKKQKAIMISDEALTIGEFMLRSGKWPIVSNHAATARRIKQILNDVHIMVVIRNQPDWLVSWHRQGLKTGKYTEVDFKRWLEKDIGEKRRDLFSLLRYDRLYSAYTDIFGNDRVHIQLYEQYRHDLALLAEEFAGILGVNRGVARQLMQADAQNVTGDSFTGLPPLIQRTVRLRLIRQFIDRLPAELTNKVREALKTKRDYIPPPKKFLNKIRRHFSESNEYLFRQLGIDARGFGYLDETI